MTIYYAKIFRATSRPTFKMDTMQILFTLRDGNSFLDVYISDLQPLSHSFVGYYILIVNADPHIGLFTLACHSSYNPLLERIIFRFTRHCTARALYPTIQMPQLTTWNYERTKLQGQTIDVCAIYCCLFGIYFDWGYTQQHIIAIFEDRGCAVRQVNLMFASEFRAYLPLGTSCQCYRS
jgi:hypothetical protein